MPATYEIRADYDRESIVVYQAYPEVIATVAVQNNRFVPPFSLNRMTWIKPSFLWLMERSNWGQKSGQEHILAARITRFGWEEALSKAVLTHPEGTVYRDYDDWKQRFDAALVLVQWDPERSIRGAALECRSIQVGLSRHIIGSYVNDWTLEIRDYTPLVRKLYRLIKSGHVSQARELLPKERIYPLNPQVGKRIGVR
jgi:uncharacterized protein DUF4291